MSKTAMNIQDIVLFTKNRADKWASMRFNVNTTGRKYSDNVFEINVWPADPNDPDNGKPISIQLDVVTFGVFLQNLKAAIDATPPQGEDFYCPVINEEATKWVKDGGKNKPDGTFVKSSLYMGKDKEGFVWIAIMPSKKSRPNLKFVFHLNKLRKLVYKDGSPLSEAALSVLSAQSFYNLFNQLVYSLLVKGYTEEEAQDNGNNNQRSSNNNSNHQPSNDAVEDDIPF